MTTRRRTVVLVALIAATVALGASAVAAFRGTGDGPAAPTGPEVTGGPAEHDDPDYWTEERMRGAKPAPMPTPPEGP